MKLLTQTGVSILQTLIISAVLAGMALLGTSMLSDQKKAQKGAQTTDDIVLFHQVITSVLQDKKHCTATLLGNSPTNIPGGAWKTLPTASALDTIFLSQVGTGGSISNAAFAKRWSASDPATYMNGNIKIDGIRIFRYDTLNDLYRFEIDYAKVNDRSTSARVITKFVTDITLKNDGGTVDSCYANMENVNTSTAQEFCQSLGSLFTWDAAAKDCRMSQHLCPNGNEIFVGIRSDGTAVCKNTAYYTDWANLIDTSASCNPTAPNTTVNLAYDGNRIRIVCNTSGCGSPVNGGWSAWSEPPWSACSGGVQSRTRTRTCTNPSASCGGTSCLGSSSDPQTQSCGGCTPSWPMDTSAMTCVGHCVIQDDGCGNTRVIVGTSTAPPHMCMQNANGPGADCGGVDCSNPSAGSCGSPPPTCASMIDYCNCSCQSTTGHMMIW